ncbi:MAG TPA: hypothetical protein PLZ49_01285 [Bacillota bacterium]|nr:hypothetical protein [Bacillota bacterium]HOL14805.1 hypothetical protein [Bacillota bacterium]
MEQKVFSKANACLYLLNAIVSSGKQPVFGPGMPAPISKWPLDAAVRELFDKTAMLD